MIRYAIILIAAMGSFGALAAFQDTSAGTPAANAHPAINETVIEKNFAYPVLGPQEWVACTADDCSDVPPNQ